MFVNKEYNAALAARAEIDFSIDLEGKNTIPLSVVDQFDAQPFMRGENGFNRNVISQILAAESQDLREMLLSRIGKDQNFGGFDKNTPASEVIAQTMPRNCQTASSCRDWVSFHDKSIGKYVDDLQKQYEEIQAKMNPSQPAPSEDIIDKV